MLPRTTDLHQRNRLLSATQRELIQALRTNSREKLKVLAKRLGVPISTLHDRLYKLKRQKRIRLVSLPDYCALQLPLQAWVFIQARDRTQTQEFLSSQLNVNTVLAVHNGADFACECVFANFKEYDAFLQVCREYGAVDEHPVIEVICQETARVDS